MEKIWENGEKLVENRENLGKERKIRENSGKNEMGKIVENGENSEKIEKNSGK